MQKGVSVGPNILAVEAKNGSASPAGIVAKLVVESPEWGNHTFVSDASWKSSQKPGVNWQRAGFDDAAWQAAKIAAPFGGGPVR